MFTADLFELCIGYSYILAKNKEIFVGSPTER